jgi:hypothetical protein
MEMTHNAPIVEPAALNNLAGQLLAVEHTLLAIRHQLSQLTPEPLPPSPLAATAPEVQGPPGRRLIPLSSWNDYHPWPTEAALRHLKKHASHNGFRRVIRIIGERIVIDEQAFFVWVDEVDASAGPSPYHVSTRRLRPLRRPADASRRTRRTG